MGVPGLHSDCVELGAIACTPTSEINLLQTDHVVYGAISLAILRRATVLEDVWIICR